MKELLLILLGVIIGYVLNYVIKILGFLLSRPYSIVKPEKTDESPDAKRMTGDSTTDAPLPETEKKKNRHEKN